MKELVESFLLMDSIICVIVILLNDNWCVPLIPIHLS